MSDFYAKPSGGYLIDGSYGTNNILKIYDYLKIYGYTKNCIIGMLGNIYAESSLNPWLWENNIYNLNNGYGLFQYTPASEYINATGVPNHAPNLSTSIQTEGADPDDAKGQLYCFITDRFGKWVSSCWRSYWSTTTYADLYDIRRNILDTYGNGSSLTLAQFKTINNYSDACFAFLACFEGPAVPNYYTRVGYCNLIRPIVDGHAGMIDDILFKKVFFIDRNFSPL